MMYMHAALKPGKRAHAADKDYVVDVKVGGVWIAYNLHVVYLDALACK